MINTVICGDCVEVMQGMPDNYVDLTVTSPPYDSLRAYEGYVFDFENIAKELYRITKQGGVVVWVVGDATIKGSETGTSFKQALFFKEIGFNLHDTMIYGKTSQPRQNGYRYEQQFEYMFVLSKGKCTIKNPIKEKSKFSGKQVKRTCRDGGKDYLTFSEGKVSEYKIKGNIWEYGAKTNNTQHPAIFPEQLAEDHILSWSNPGDLVFDPMCGSGTTLKMAKKNGRDFLGIDISENYCAIAEERVKGV